ncbi:MAG TPA: hypothetical protein VHR86_04605 [Armatimonadota bacterium]|nr:hypothetical protein [Armatimonadota bacterium]
MISAALVAFMGATATLVGMTAHMMYPGIRPIVAMPTFIQHTFPSFLGGIILGGLLLSVVMTGSGLTLGVATVLSRDIYQNLIHPNCSETRLLMVSRGIILATLATVLLVAFSNFNSLILQWAFLSMALRGVAIFIPLLRSLFGWKPASRGFATYGNYISPLLAVGAGLFSRGRLDPLYTGLACYLLFWLLEAGAGARQRRVTCHP